MSFTSARDVYLAAGARGVSYLGDFLAATALVLALQERGAGGAAVAAVLIANVLPAVLLAPLVGRLVDRVDSRPLLTAFGLGQAACCAAMAYTESILLLVGLSALLAAGLAVTSPTFNALLPQMAGRDAVGRAMAIGQTATGLGSLAGPALGGVLVGTFGLRVPLLIDAVTYLAVVAAGLLIRTRRRGGVGTAGPHVVAGWRIRDDRTLLALTVMVGALILAVNVLMVVGVFFVRESLGGSAAQYGLWEACWLAGMLAGGWIAATRAWDDARLGRAQVVLHISTGALIAVAGFAPGMAWLYPLWLLGGALNGAENNFLGVLAARRVPEAVRGAFFARFGAVVNGANLIGYALGGVLVGRFAPEEIIIGCGLAGVAVTAVLGVPLWRASRAGDARSGVEVEPVTVARAAAP